MGCPFGFNAVRQQAVKLEGVFYDLKHRASELAIQLMRDAYLTTDEIRDVCIAGLVSYRVESGKRCREVVTRLQKEHPVALTRLFVAISDLEQYIDHTFVETDDIETIWVVRALIGYPVFTHDNFIKNIEGLDEVKR